MHFLNRVEFYTTNVCNLNCPSCNRFNNFAFKGHHKWADYEPEYLTWSKKINFIESVGIMGGEPLSNPDLPNWMEGISRLWPNVNLYSMATNGTYLNTFPDLYELCKKYKFRMTISGHNAKNILNDIENIKNFFPTPPLHKLEKNTHLWKSRYLQSKQAHWPDFVEIDAFDSLSESIQQEAIYPHVIHPWQLFQSHFTDGHVNITFRPILYFYQSPIIYDSDTNSLTVHNSDPVKSMNICYFKTCPIFVQGKLYKCSPTALLPEFINQFHVNVSDLDRKLIHAYRAAQADWSYTEIETFLQNQKNADPVPQCKFCPETLVTGMPLLATTKKIKITKKIDAQIK
jgi:organic radical activating enzyme